MRKDPPTCPSCGTVFDPEALLKSRRARPMPVEEVKKAPVETEDEERLEIDTEEETVEEEAGTGEEDVEVADVEDEEAEVLDEDEDVLLEDADELGDDDEIEVAGDGIDDEDR
jgi:hypothetical protein